ncbi:nitrate ABC transporter permease [Aquabacterium sp. J223]|uniref:nitrate ABC transporter permease n=1 Tax=Aquabacterium sp. J223 TaxID=2898431 RepID=UPI0021AD5840|nr:nitrate ABC transporter permease [Aquabacterium sp. J223]UUX96009.1 nitrate ABC transporter permease [Aquabacterium sp. J223]
MGQPSLAWRSGLLSLLLLALLLGVWHLATLSNAPAAAPAAAVALTPEQIEYAKLMGKDPTAGAGAPTAKSGFPTLGQMGATVLQHLASPFHDNGPNDKGLGLQLAYSLGRVALGYGIAALVAIPLGFVIGMSPLIYRALDPFIQVLKPISPLAWMPLALYTIKDSAASGIFVIFICSVWPMLINTAFGVAGVRREWLNVARTLEVRPLRKAFEVILPAAAPTILTGMRISMGIAWLVIVAAEMLVGGTGIGYFVWNEWNNLSLPNVIVAILVIGLVGMALDLVFGRLQKAVTYAD